MKSRKILAVCLSALLFAAPGCGASNQLASSGASSAVSPAPSSGVSSSKSKTAEPFLGLSMATEKIGYAVAEGLHVLRTSDGWATCTDLGALKNAAADSGTPAVFALGENTAYAAPWNGWTARGRIGRNPTSPSRWMPMI